MNDTLSTLTGLLGGYGGNTGSSRKQQSDPQYYGQSDYATSWPDGTTTMGEDTIKRKKLEAKEWEQKTSADDDLSSMRQYPEDSLVAHIAPWEADLLSLLGGAGNVNKQSGLLQFGWGGGDGDDSDAGSDTGGVDNGGQDGDRGMDAGSLGGADRGGTGSDTDGSDYGGHGFDRGGGSRSSDSGSSGGGFGDEGATALDSGVIGSKFKNAYQSGMQMAAQAPTTAETMDGMSPAQRSDYMSNVAALDSGPFGQDTGLMRDTTPTSKAGSMFNDAKMKQLTDSLNLGSIIDQGLMSAGYNTSPPTDVLSQAQLSEDDTYNKFFNKDWSKMNLTNFQGSTPQNAMSNDAFTDYAVNSPVALSAMSAIRDMELAGMDVSGMGITSGNQGKHAPNSQHYSNNAVDVNSKVNSKSFSGLTSAMEKAGYNRGDKLGFGSGESHHFQ